ncbi:Endonuclease/Exonuclease/phosphatase family protein [Nocardioides dokdonensis FR1436]|uniref:Endonuclease/Exonuclease/phosphatase family protein n=1 Tax=Nocardioides dokdonensis FR1436 TaxID=1300347 RepID=A0A1A9GE97_9ACTN|nr:endonuclease/exonuclease/phosphatase family protein [Nocardioides dokdonensis]ANH36578.1 Endonuclease/Exonuclease/phosphatase family protein [Nocardioides dokdonensis FR1436]
MAKHYGSPTEGPGRGALVQGLLAGVLALVIGAAAVLLVTSQGGRESASVALGSDGRPLPPANQAGPRSVVTGVVIQPEGYLGEPGETRTPRPQRVHGGGKLARRVRAASRDEGESSQGPTTFRVSSFNVLGANHTKAGGRHSRFTDGVTRMRWAIQILANEGVTVAGLQELQAPQYNTLRSSAPVWQVYPGPGLGPGPMANSVIWRSDVWTRVEAATVAIPYFGGRRVPMPYVLLQHNATGQQVWFANFHNPADAHGPAQKWRNAAVGIEAALANRLTATGTPLVMTGDFNDRAEFFCPITRSSSLRAANGGSTGSACAPPARMNVDWILGSPDITFSSFAALETELVNRTTDHPVIVATGTIGGTGESEE